MPAAILGPIAGAAVGGLMSKGSSQQSTNEPWAPAQPMLQDLLKQGQALGGYYQQNPFNNLQRTAYQNTFSDIDNARNNVMPGLLSITNKYLQKGGSPGISLLTSGAANPGGGAPAQSYGLLDFKALNPYTNGALDVVMPKTPQEEEEERKKREQEAAWEQYMAMERQGAGA